LIGTLVAIGLGIDELVYVGLLSTFYFYLSTGEARLSTRAAQRTSFLIGTLGAIGFGVDELVYVGLLSTFYFYLSTGEARLSTREAQLSTEEQRSI
jgi:hypothetical protein